MKKTYIAILFCIGLSYAFGQVGINTTTPKATLDITVNKIAGKAEGLIIPRLTAVELNGMNSLYLSNQNSALVYITSGVGFVGTKTENINGEGYYYYDATNSRWKKIATGEKTYKIGDIKYSLKSNDHDGWVKIDGRAITLLSANQKTNSMSLGFSSNLPNANNSVLVQNNLTLGSISGNNQIILARNNLPNVTISGSSSITGSHTHNFQGTVNPSNWTHSPRSSDTWHPRANQTTVNSNTAGNHAHTFNLLLNGGVAQQPFNVMPQSLSVNVFVFLGN